TALSQQPCLTYEAQGGKTIYRPRDFAAFLGELGITGSAEVSPVMAHQFQIHFIDSAAAAEALASLLALEYPGYGRAMNAHRKGATVFAGCRVFQRVPHGAMVRHRGRSLP